MAAISILLSLLDFLFGIILIFFTIIIFHPINKLKRYKVKEDQLFLQKTLITTIFFCLFLLLNLLSYFSDDLKKYTYIASNFVFNAFVMILIIYNLLISIELIILLIIQPIILIDYSDNISIIISKNYL